ncbi:putative dioxygenase [Corynespora cassiicola Philippines]|uniref:Putative dioxygenase n=1 Tax=Corynespora cassiicola Philippines TaxID=1448308 RepID=A0A2T2PC74_CORCC|nr:putative dioxygenase [Corynespora cassiicola Philippines]
MSSQHDNRSWPNLQGFSPEFEQHDAIELPVRGFIPPYAEGVLYRTGPGGFKVKTDQGNTFAVDHLFDGISQVHRFQLKGSEDANSGSTVTFNSRIVATKLVEEIKKKGTADWYSMATKPDPSTTYVERLSQLIQASEHDEPNDGKVNIGVTLSVNTPGLKSKQQKVYSNKEDIGVKTLHTKTDGSIMQQIDPVTLEPITSTLQSEFHPELKGPLGAAHSRTDPKTGDFFNYNLDVGYPSIYRLFKTSKETGKTTILASIPAQPAYLHSFFLTEQHVILCVWNAHFKDGGLGLVWNGNILDSMAPFDPSIPSMWYVVDRIDGHGLLATYEGPPFFAFHTINADPSKMDVIYTSDPTGSLYEVLAADPPLPQEVLLEGKKQSPNYLSRFRLPEVPELPFVQEAVQSVVHEYSVGENFGPELPAMNGNYLMRPHRYTYAPTARGLSTYFDGLVKFDSETKEFILWSEHAQSPGEGLFVANPEGVSEDDGVLLSVVLNGFTGKSYLLCLDAKTMQELGRADVPGAVGFGFHGTHVPSSGHIADV